MKADKGANSGKFLYATPYELINKSGFKFEGRIEATHRKSTFHLKKNKIDGGIRSEWTWEQIRNIRLWVKVVNTWWRSSQRWLMMSELFVVNWTIRAQSNEPQVNCSAQLDLAANHSNWYNDLLHSNNIVSRHLNDYYYIITIIIVLINQLMSYRGLFHILHT